MHVVADFKDVYKYSGDNDEDYDFDIALCHVAAMGTEYIRDGYLTDSIYMYTGDTETLILNAIYSKYTIGNTLDI